MSRFDYAQPDSIVRERDITARQQSCAGVMSPSFHCRKYKEKKKTAGRVQAVKGTSKYGWICAECAGK